ncbi:MAG: O-acetyl-ADP-ribose deacetylase [Acidobacteria bacterium]|nr:MAG: O-acetyl-ADP-ribose deacetylase [Acidobacteriota bacterium]
MDELRLERARIELVRGDITLQEVDAIVNAANRRLAGGGGVDGAIHRAAGPELAEACRELGGCPPGDAKATPGFRLKAKWVIHAVGPIYRGGSWGEAKILASAYRRSLDVAAELGARSVAFPAISTGAYGYPVKEAARIALETVSAWLEDHEGPVELVRFVLFDGKTHKAFREALDSLRR